MMMKDEIIQEVWNAKDSISAKCNHDVRRLIETLRAREMSSGARVVDLHSRLHTESRTR
jgi:hypothetical protein